MNALPLVKRLLSAQLLSRVRRGGAWVISNKAQYFTLNVGLSSGLVFR